VATGATCRLGLGALLACAVLACGPGEPPLDPEQAASLALLSGVQLEGLAFHAVDPSTPATAAASRDCAAWFVAAGLGDLHGPVLASNEGHLFAVTTTHALLFSPMTCTRRELPAVLADVVTDPGLARTLAQIVADHHAGTAATEVPYFHLRVAEFAVPPAWRVAYVVPVQEGDLRIVVLPGGTMATASAVIQATVKTPLQPPEIFTPSAASKAPGVGPGKVLILVASAAVLTYILLPPDVRAGLNTWGSNLLGLHPAVSATTSRWLCACSNGSQSFQYGSYTDVASRSCPGYCRLNNSTLQRIVPAASTTCSCRCYIQCTSCGTSSKNSSYQVDNIDPSGSDCKSFSYGYCDDYPEDCTGCSGSSGSCW
jgi:hypothetical protein